MIEQQEGPRFRKTWLCLAASVLILLPVALPAQSAWLDPDTSAPAGTRYATFNSRTIGGPASYLIYLPPDYADSSLRRYPVIYWLHGLGGTQRSGAFFVRSLDAAIRSGNTPPAIAILVNGMRDSMYCDSRDGRLPVETVIIQDLIPHVDSTWRTIADRRARAVEGYSMGGFGAARLGFKYPDLFGAISVMAGALHTEETLAARRKEIFEKIYGGDPEYYRTGSPWVLAEANADAVRGCTRVRIGVGEEDQLLEWNQRFHELLRKAGVASEYFTVPGVGHSGQRFYEVRGDGLWDFYRRAFGSTGASR